MSSTFEYDSSLAYDTNTSYDAYSPSEPAAIIISVPHLSAALQLGPDGSFLFLEQDTLDEIAQSVEMIVGTTRGERSMVPAFGIPQQPFDGPDKTQIVTAIGIWEPRASVSVQINNYDNGNSDVTVAVAKAGL